MFPKRQNKKKHPTIKNRLRNGRLGLFQTFFTCAQLLHADVIVSAGQAWRFRYPKPTEANAVELPR